MILNTFSEDKRCSIFAQFHNLSSAIVTLMKNGRIMEERRVLSLIFSNIVIYIFWCNNTLIRQNIIISSVLSLLISVIVMNSFDFGLVWLQFLFLLIL
jgi:hypothetical protein